MLGWGRARTNREHRFTAENLSAYIDRELTAAERSRVERHLATCAECRRDVESLQETVALLRRVPARPVPRSFTLPASARAVQARQRRWNTAFGALRTATVTIATMLVLVFAGDAALSGGLISPTGARMAQDAATLAAPAAQPEAPMEEAAPMIAEAAPQAGAQGEVAPYGGPEVAPKMAPDAEAPAPSETARALQPPREEWPGSRGMPGEGVGAAGPEAGGAGGGDAMGGMGGAVPAMPRINGIEGASEPAPELMMEKAVPAEGAAEAPQAESEAESLNQVPSTEAPQPEALTPPEPTPAPQPTQAPPVETTVPAEADEASTPDSLAMGGSPEGDAGEPTAEAERAELLDRQPEPAWWQTWRSLRLIAGLLAGMLLISLAGTIWAGYKRGAR